MILSNISKRERYVFSITIIIIAAALLYNFVIEAGFKKWRILNNEIAVKRARMAKGIRLIKRRDSIIREYDEFYKERAIELQIEGEMADIIKFVSQIAKPPILAILKKFDFSLISQNPSVFKGTIILSKLII